MEIHKLKQTYKRHKFIIRAVGVMGLIMTAPEAFAAAIDLNTKLGDPAQSIRGVLDGNGKLLIYAVEGILGIIGYKKSGNNIMMLFGIVIIMFFLNFILGIIPGQAPVTGG